MTAELTWRPSPTTHRLATIALVAFIAAAASGRGALVALGAPALLWIGLYLFAERPSQLRVDANVHPRLFREGDQATVTLLLPRNPAGVGIRPSLPGGTAIPDPDQGWRWTVVMHEWGNHPPGAINLRLETPGGLWTATLTIQLPIVEVLPHVQPPHAVVSSTVRRPNPGTWAGKRAGSGTEFLGVRRHTPGEEARRIHWPSTIRRGKLHITTFTSDHAQDVVLVVDAITDVGPPGNTTVDRSVRGAAGLAQAYLRQGDRVGLVTVAPALSWVAPGTGRRHEYRLNRTLIVVREHDSVLPPDLQRVPPAALPPGATVVIFTPLLHDQSFALAADLRRRGHPTGVIDPLTTEPPINHRSAHDVRTLRLWRLARIAALSHLADRGILVIPWPTDAALDALLAPIARRPLPPIHPGRAA